MHYILYALQFTPLMLIEQGLFVFRISISNFIPSIAETESFQF